MTEGNAAYQRGDYAGAAKSFQSAIDAGASTADTWFNLGTAQLKAGNRGPAILAFERALKIDPNDADAAFNLSEAEKGNIDKIVGATDEAPVLERIGALIPVKLTGVAFLASWLLANGLLLLWWLRRQVTAALLAGAVAMLFALTVGIAFWIGAWERTHSPYAIVTAATAPVREGPASDFKAAFEIHEGLKVRIVRSENGFARVRLPNGTEGWVAAKDVPLI